MSLKAIRKKRLEAIRHREEEEARQKHELACSLFASIDEGVPLIEPLEKFDSFALIPELHALTSNKFLNCQEFFFRELRKKFNFKTLVRDHINFEEIKHAKFVLATKHVQDSNIDTLIELSELPESITLISYFTDLNFDGKKKYIENLYKMLKRSNIILTAYWEYFIKNCPELEYKTIFFPHCFSPQERYVNLQFLEEPEKQCILFGAIDSRSYPLRLEISQKKELSKLIQIMPHPGYKEDIKKTLSEYPEYIGDNYAKILNSFVCAITTPSKYCFPLRKYFEIPAAGSLLLGVEVKELEYLGFIPNVHYIRIEKENFAENIINSLNDIFSNTKKYDQIRKNGMEFVRKYHGLDNRIEFFGRILENYKQYGQVRKDKLIPAYSEV